MEPRVSEDDICYYATIESRPIILNARNLADCLSSLPVQNELKEPGLADFQPYYDKWRKLVETALAEDEQASLLWEESEGGEQEEGVEEPQEV